MENDGIIYYSDEQNDDFGEGHEKVNVRCVTDKYRYERRNPFMLVLSAILYRGIATPFAFCFMKICFGLKIKNRAAVRKLKGGYFLYGNHTQDAADAFIPTLVAFPRRTNIIVSANAVSIPVVRVIVPMLGGIPLASTVHGKINFMSDLNRRTARGQAVTVYPEAHIWPYYNGIRNYSDASFVYPMKLGLPAVGFTVTYRQRKVFRKLPPLITVTLSNPVMPCDCTDRRDMRNRIHTFMCETAQRENSFAYKEYRKK